MKIICIKNFLAGVTVWKHDRLNKFSFPVENHPERQREWETEMCIFDETSRQLKLQTTSFWVSQENGIQYRYFKQNLFQSCLQKCSKRKREKVGMLQEWHGRRGYTQRSESDNISGLAPMNPCLLLHRWRSNCGCSLCAEAVLPWPGLATLNRWLYSGSWSL